MCVPLAAAWLTLAGCAPRPVPPAACVWLAACEEPAFDPDGPPDPMRWALERMLTRGLVEEDSTGRIVPAAAERIEVARDSLTYTFHLRQGLRFADGAPCLSADFRRALVAGLGRTDHSTRDWLLAAVRGVDRVRAGKPLPDVGIGSPDESTVVVRLSRRDPLLLAKLALPGVSGPWTDRGPGGWLGASGIGPYRAAGADSGRRLTLVRVAAPARRELRPAAPETVTVRFGIGAPRARALMRGGLADLVWPAPPGLLDEPLPAGYRPRARRADPERMLLLVMRPDVPPTSKLATRHALAHGLNRGELARSLGPLGQEVSVWLPGTRPFDFPKLDDEEVRRWLDRGELGRSFHVVMTYDASGAAAAVARVMQGNWSRHAIYVELRPAGGRRLANELLRGGAHLLLVEAQSLPGAAAELAALVMPLRGPAVGSFRTGWRTREFDPWITPRRAAAPLPLGRVLRRLEEEMVALPLVYLPWVWVERDEEPGAPFHPHFGPGCAPRGMAVVAGRKPVDRPAPGSLSLGPP